MSDLIKIDSNIKYLEVIYPDRVEYVRYSLTKEIRYDVADSTVILVLYNGSTVEFKYHEVEDHQNAGYPYASGTYLYLYILQLYGLIS